MPYFGHQPRGLFPQVKSLIYCKAGRRQEFSVYVEPMISDNEALAAFCKTCRTHDFVTVDTEFHRERTYYSELCLLQIAYPGEGSENAVLIDPMAPGLDLTPVYDLFRDPSVIKVFHAARQDLEIFYVDAGVFPEPFFDTQIAAMVCGFGEQVGYETLVRRLARASLDKTSRFTDWSRRPLSKKQQSYALADVTHLRVVYEKLRDELAEKGRAAWVEEELALLTDPATYEIDPREAWRRIKTRNSSGQFLAVLREVAAFREETARARNVPRNRIIKDDAILEIASVKPKTEAELSKSRLLLREARKGEIAAGLVAAIRKGLDVAPAEFPSAPPTRQRHAGHEGLTELLKVLLKAKAAEAGVAARLIASASEVEEIASGILKDLPALRGWRRQVFGEDALRLVRGEVALSANGSEVEIIDIPVHGVDAAE